MIDRRSFTVGMGVLAERCGRNLPAPVQSGYYQILSSELTTEEYEVAVQLAFRHARFWPSPQELIDYARPPRDLGLEAAAMFERARDVEEISPLGMCFWRRDKIAPLGEAALAGFDAIGGQERFRTMTSDGVSWVRREFVAAYRAKATETKSERAIEAVRKSLEIPLLKRSRIQSGPVAVGALVGSVVKGITDGAEP